MATSQYIQYPSPNVLPNVVLTGSTSGAITLVAPAVVTSYTLTFPNAQGGAGTGLQNDGSGNLSWVTAGGITVGTIDSQTAAANGLVISGDVIYAQSASATVPGLVNTTTQTFAGAKTVTSVFNGSTTANAVGIKVTTRDTATGNTDHKSSGKLQATASIWNGSAAVAKGLSLYNQGISGTNSAYSLVIDSSDVSNIIVARGDGSGSVGIGSAPDTTYQLDVFGKLHTSSDAVIGGAASASNLSGTNTGDLTLAAVGSTPGSNGASLSGQVLTLQPADGSNPGVLTAGTQTIGGAKTFSSTIAASNFSGTSSGTNTGDVSLAAVGSSPSANGASFSSQVLTLQPADGTHPGLVTSGTQTIGGDKTFSGAVSASNLSGTNTGDLTLAAIGSTANANGASLSGQALNLQPASASFGGVVTTGTQSFAGNKTFTGNLNTQGALQITAATVAGGPVFNTASVTPVLITGTGGGTTGGGTGSFAFTAGSDGLLVVDNSTKGNPCLVWMYGGGATLAIISDAASKYSTVAGTASKDNLTVANGTLTIEHNSDTTNSNNFRVLFIRMD